MKQYSFKTLTFLFFSLLTVFASCKKDLRKENGEIYSDKNFVEEAKAWFAKGPVAQEKELLNLPIAVLPANDPKRIFARMGKMQRNMNWENAEIYYREGLRYLVVPIEKNLMKNSSEYEIAQSIVFYKNKKDEIKMNVVEVLSKKGTLLKGMDKEIISTAFFNSIKQENGRVIGVNAKVFLYDEEYKILSSYQINNGDFTPYLGNLKNIKINPTTQSGSPSLTETEGCQVWNVYLITYDQYGIILEIQFLFQYIVGSCTGTPNEDQLPQGGGSGGIDTASVVNASILNFISGYGLASASNKLTTELLSDDGVTRSKRYTSQCGQALLIDARSIESGTHKYVNGVWEWETLTHESLNIHGNVVGGSASVTSHSGSASIGTENATMLVNYSVKYTVNTPGFPSHTWTEGIVSSVTWHIDD